jgi:arylsulfatase A-like enzyme
MLPNRSIWTSVLFLALILSSPGWAEEPRRPNILVILSDDQGWGDLSLHGNTNLRTPHLDGLARAGATFERFYVQPVCSPTRAEFLTGRYHPRVGVRGVTTGGERLNLEEATIANAFTEAGYRTGCFGKWHNGSQMPYHPNGRGFREFYGFTSGHWGDYFSPPLDHNGETVQGTGFLTDDITTRAIRFISNEQSNPFFCFLALNTPHSPMQVPDSYWNRKKKTPLKLLGRPQEDQQHTRAALAMCENLDDNVGRVLQALVDLKLAEDTIVVFFHDNGPNGPRWNGQMKGHKGSTDEGGVRSPCFVRWPKVIKPDTNITAIAGAIDLLPTLCELAGVKPTGSKPLDGISLAKSLRGEAVDPSERLLFQHWNGKVSVRSQRFRLDAAGKLYDMVTDPEQRREVNTNHPEEAKRLQAAVTQWRAEVLANLEWKDTRPFPVGHPGHRSTLLPARDGVPHGTIRRSAAAPNCSYFTHWTKSSDRVTWEVEVLRPGRYRVELLETCAAENVGVTLEMKLGKASVRNTVTMAHDPPATGPVHDRVPRGGESPMKDFQRWQLGEWTIPAGRGTLELSAPVIPGKEALEVRGVVLVWMGKD